MTCGRQRQRVAVLDARDSGRTCRQQSHDTERKHVRPPTGGIYARPSQRSTPARPLAASAWWLGGMRRVSAYLSVRKRLRSGASLQNVQFFVDGTSAGVVTTLTAGGSDRAQRARRKRNKHKV